MTTEELSEVIGLTATQYFQLKDLQEKMRQERIIYLENQKKNK
jgi:hypothetical protein